jgi:hypothetical protein
MKTRLFVLLFAMIVGLCLFITPAQAEALADQGVSHGLAATLPQTAALQTTCAITQLQPTGTITTTSRPTFQWSYTGSCTVFYLWIVGTKIDTPIVNQAAPACVNGTCSWTPTSNYANGNYSWYVFGFPNGTWTGPMTYQINVPIPAGFTSPPWTGWQGTSGTWLTIGSGSGQWLYTQGVPGKFASTAYPTTFADLDYTVTMLRIGCTWCAHGIDIRGTPGSPDGGWLNAYQFEINQNGYFSIWRGVNDQWTALQNWTYSSAIRRFSNWNTMRVLAVGSNLYLFINGIPVWSGVNTSLTSGQVGAFVARVGSSTTTDVFYLQSAQLTVPVTLATNSMPEVSAEQKAANTKANQSPQGSPSGGPH